jgi:hypothetical protein
VVHQRPRSSGTVVPWCHSLSHPGSGWRRKRLRSFALEPSSGGGPPLGRLTHDRAGCFRVAVAHIGLFVSPAAGQRGSACAASYGVTTNDDYVMRVRASAKEAATSGRGKSQTMSKPSWLLSIRRPYSMIGSWRLFLKRRSGPPFAFA